LQLLLGVWLYGEPFGGERLAGFAVIWSALAVYSLEGLWRAWSARTA
jgi:chloramphenicol-sensitive protein RarD